MAAVAALTVAVWPMRWRWPTAVLGAMVVGLIGIAVVYNSWHWLSDVLAGWCISVAWVAALYLIFRHVPRRRVDDSGAELRPDTGRRL